MKNSSFGSDGPRRFRVPEGIGLRSKPIVIGLAAVCIAALFAGCGSRLSEHTLAAAAHRPIVRGTALGSQAAGSQATTSGGGAASTSGAAQASGPAGPSTPPSTAPGGSSATGVAPSASKPSGTASHASAGSTINLGNVGTYSGVIGAVFSGAQQTLQVWQAYTNAHGGLNGHPVHLFIEDDGADPSTSATDVQQEVTQDHVIAFVGNLVPLTVNASVQYLQQQNIPVIGGDASSTTWWQSPVLFPQAGSALLPHEALFTINKAVAKGDTKMGLLYCVEDTTCTAAYQSLIQQGTAKQDGVDPVYTSSFSITQPDFTAQCINAKQAGANFIYFAGDGDSLIRMANDCAAQGYDPQYVGDSIAITSQVAADPHLNGLIAGQSNFPWIDSFTPAQAQYQQAVKTYAPSLKGSATTAAEWAAGMLAVAASSALTANPTSAQFFQGLWAIKNNTLGGLSPPLTFNANAPATPSNCYFLMILQNGQFVDVQNGGTQCVS